MAEPLSLETIESEFTEETEAWTLRDEKTRRYLIIHIQVIQIAIRYTSFSTKMPRKMF